MNKGRCLCGDVRFTLRGGLTSVVTCHCKMCRQWHGAPGPYTNTRWDEVEFEAKDGLAWYPSSSFAQRGFCRTCGSSLFWRRNGSADVSIAAGAVDDPTGLRSERHIYVADKGDWYAMTDGLPTLPGGGT
jgi:hypothetical protein